MIWAWLLLMGGLGLVLAPLLGVGAPNLVLTDVIAFAAAVLPTWLYLTLNEASMAAGTIGKRLRGLAVASDPARAHVASVALRNAVKLLPWQLAHLAVPRLLFDTQGPFAIGCVVAALVLTVGSVAMAVVDPHRRALHDRVARTQVVTIDPIQS